MPNLIHAGARRELDLLVRTGLGIEQVAPALARLLRMLVGAEGCFIGWFDSSGAPVGFFHDSAPAQLQAFFLDNRSLFKGPNEFTIFSAARTQGAVVSHVLHTDRAFYKSNTFNLLLRPCDHHHGVGLRVEVHGVTRIGIGLFRNAAQPFSESDAHQLRSLIPSLQIPFIKTPGRVPAASAHPGGSAGGGSTGSVVEAGQLLMSPDGSRIHMISEQATRLLTLDRRIDQGVCFSGDMTSPPHFIKQLCQALMAGSNPTAQSQIAVIGGTLVVVASWMKSPFGSALQGALLPGDNILVTLRYHPASAIALVGNVSHLGLSPLQSRIAMFAATGGSRGECAMHHQVSKEALKKHLREIYAASRCSDWDELARLLSAQ